MMINSFTGEHAFLSNFYPSPIVYRGKEYPTAEHLYQALKTPKLKLRERIRKAPTPAKAKRLGRMVVMRGNWETAKDNMMFMVVRMKFTQNAELGEKLKVTQDTLVEGNSWHDNYWGCCVCHKCDAKFIVGKNKLGQTLMAVREAL